MGLDIVETIMAVESQFDIEIENSEAERIRTVGDLYKLILIKQPRTIPHFPLSDPVGSILGLQPLSAITYEDKVWQALVALVVEQAGVDKAQIHREASFVDDLRMD